MSNFPTLDDLILYYLDGKYTESISARGDYLFSSQLGEEKNDFKTCYADELN